MPAVLSFPGVYIEEVQSGVRTITGVATSITAFVGRALRGPIDAEEKSPVRIFSFADYQRVFGGLSPDCPMSFAVFHYFLNGGTDALIVRVQDGAKASQFPALPDPALFTAANPGEWGDSLVIGVDYDVDQEILDANPADTMFNLQVKDLATNVSETYLNVSITDGHPRFVSKVLENQSRLLRGAEAFTERPEVIEPIAPDASLTGGFDGAAITAPVVSDPGLSTPKHGLFALEKADLFNLLVIPPFSPTTDVDTATWTAAVAYCKERRAFALIDPPFNGGATPGWDALDDVTASAISGLAGRSENAALFFPRVRAPNPLREGRPEAFAPCGAVAGVMARTDAQRGVWKSAAGIDAALQGVLAPEVGLTDRENGLINPLGVNCIRSFPNTGTVVWGARTLRGADSLASEWKYTAVRRTALFLEESLYRGTQWVVFEPNDEPLWAQIRLNLGAFMQSLFRQGAFQGKSPREAYFVKCDSETTTQTDINAGIVNIVVGFAPLKPAEFVVIKLQQIAGDIPT
jgi:phage tail sheath protein FI